MKIVTNVKLLFILCFEKMGSGQILVCLLLLSFTCWQNFYLYSNVKHIQACHYCYSFSLHLFVMITEILCVEDALIFTWSELVLQYLQPGICKNKNVLFVVLGHYWRKFPLLHDNWALKILPGWVSVPAVMHHWFSC